MEIVTLILSILAGILTLVQLFMKHRQDTATIRGDDNIDKTVASGDGKAIGSFIHSELDRMRDEDTKQQ